MPFYTKVQTSAAVGEGPDVMTYHTSRIPLAVEQGILQEITADDMKAMGLGEDSFAPAIWEAVQSTASNTPCRSIRIRSCSTTTRTSSPRPA